MKKSKSKRILAIFLSILMVMTSVPVVAFTAFAADDAAVTEVENAMADYEKKMDGTVYTNMSAAYTAYVNCQKALDAYKYGGVTNALSGKAAALTSATANMQAWSAYTGTGRGTFQNDGDNVSDADYAENYKNVLYAEKGVGPTVSYHGANEDAGPHGKTLLGGDAGAYTADTRFYTSNNTTLLYDGVTAPQFGIMLTVWGNSKPWNYNWNNLRIYYAYVGSAQGLSMLEDWHGTDTSGDDAGSNLHLNYQWTVRQTDRSCTGYTQNVYYQNGMNGKALANTIKFDKSFTDLMLTITNPTLYYCTGSDLGYTEHTGTLSATTIRVLNYKKVVDAINNSTYTTLLTNVEHYKEGGLAAFMEGYDKAQADPNSFFVSTNDWQGCQTHYQDALDKLASTPTADSEGYKAVRDAMTAPVMNTYNNGTNGWTTETWEPFVAAYEAAQAMMAAPYNSGSYSATNGKEVADTLTAAYNALASNKEYADTTELQTLIDNFRNWEKIFTDDTYNQVSAIVSDAIVKVWGSEDNFGIKTMGPELTPEGEKLVADEVLVVKDALKLLRISPDASVVTPYGRKSLNNEIALTVENPEKYYNIDVFNSAVAAGIEYRNTLPVTEFTDYETQYNAYRDAVLAIADAYHNLAYAFTDIPDGTVIQNSGIKQCQPMSATDQGYMRLDFSYTTSAVLIKTNHTAETLPYGTFSVGFGTNIRASNNNDFNGNKNTNNSLDSITLNATAAPKSDNFMGARTSAGVGGSNYPRDISAEDRALYEGSLTYDGGNGVFSIGNLHYTGKSSNCGPKQILTLSDGTVITDEAQAKSTNLDSVLETLDGGSTNNIARGSVFAYSSDGAMAFTYIDGEMRVMVEPVAQVELTSKTLPSTRNLRMTGNYLGAVANYNCRNINYFYARCWFTTQSAGDVVDSSVAVVDISYLVDLVNMCKPILAQESKYTADSFADFKQALLDAQAFYDYTNQSAATITREASNRYAKLWQAYEWLVERPQVLTFNYYDAQGVMTSSTLEIPYGALLSTKRTEIEAITVPNYSLNGTSYTFKGWDGLNYATTVNSDLTFNATYDSFATAYWGNYNASQDKLRNDLANGKYSLEGLNAIKAEVDALQYFLLTDNEKLMVAATNQSAIDAEKAKIDEIDAELAQYALDSSTYEAILKTVDTLNADAYDVATVQATLSSTSAGTEIEIAGVTYTGWNYDAYVATAMEAMNNNAYEYTVTVMDVDETEYFLMSDGSYSDDPAMAAKFHYGDVVNAVNPCDPAQECSWTVTIVAQLTATETTGKYVKTGTNYEFNVRGNTTIMTSANFDPDSYHTISFIDGRNNTLISTMAVADNSTARMRDAVLPTVPFYEVKNFTNRATGETVTKTGTIKNVKQDINLTVNYSPVEDVTGYTITLLDADGNTLYSENHNWNSKVTLTASGAAGMVNKDTGKLVAYGSEYTFYACESITLQAVNTVDGKVAVSVAAPVISNGNVYFTGSFAKQGHVPNNDPTVKGYGIVIDVYGNNKDLTLKDVDANNFVFNLAASKETCGSQFTLYTGAPSGRNVTYRAYVIYEVNGTELIEYSDVVNTTIE